MEVMFDVMKYEEEKLIYDMNRFLYLYRKYKESIDEVLEFVELYNRFCHTKKNKYKEDNYITGADE